MKKAAKSFIVSILAGQVKRLRQRHDFKVVAVVGGIGKTSTKLAIAQVLKQSLRVRYQKGNYNDLASVPLIFFNQPMPSLFNPFSWALILLKNEMQLRKQFPFDVVVVELGTDCPGQISAFKKYLHADITVVTALVPEHMENFTDMSAVAKEELSVADFSRHLIMNTDLCPEEYTAEFSGAFLSYAIDRTAAYQLKGIRRSNERTSFNISKNNVEWIDADNAGFSKPQLYSLLAAAAVADHMGIAKEDIIKGFERIKPVSGRMQLLEGIKNSKIIDDSYNASPDAMKSALTTLYAMPATHKIALLGNMNELGKFSVESHRMIGHYCDPKKLDVVITLGRDANKYLAVSAEAEGCYVERFESPYAAGKWLAEHIKENTLVLVKGSQNRVFAEEAIKPLLAHHTDSAKLVRQSKSWLKMKKSQFDQ
jgi:UDP-N-acetylmuramoyl-tripeptide--D-alanyl-D-alanine ligase